MPLHVEEYGPYVRKIGNVLIRVEACPDSHSSEKPWDWDGSGPVSEWTSRSKRPGERVLAQSGSRYRYYDWQEACRMARRDKWNAEPYDAHNQVERAVQADFDYLKAWCDNEWHYLCVNASVSLHGVEVGSGRCCGVESRHAGHLDDMAAECLAEAVQEARKRAKRLAGELAGSVRHA